MQQHYGPIYNNSPLFEQMVFRLKYFAGSLNTWSRASRQQAAGDFQDSNVYTFLSSSQGADSPEHCENTGASVTTAGFGEAAAGAVGVLCE